MSFTTMSKEKLLKVADKFAVDVPEGATNKEIVKLLEDKEVTYAKYKKIFVDEEESADLDDFRSAPILVKMERKNPTFEAFGYRFTKQHPFVPMSESDAQQIFDHFDGFRIATPSEAQRFYG